MIRWEFQYGYGLLDVGAAVSGPKWLNWGVQEFAVGAGQYSFGNDMHGSGGLVKDGVGTLWLDGTNTYTGGTTVRHGVLGISKATTSNVTIEEQGALNLVGTLNGQVFNAGILTAGSADALINGSLSQQETGRLEVTAGETFHINGQLLADGTLGIVKTTPSFVANGTYNLLEATGVTGTFDQTDINAGLFLSAQVGYTNTSVTGTFQQVAVASVASLTSTNSDGAAADVGDAAFDVGNQLLADPGMQINAETTTFLGDLARLQSIDNTAQALAALDEISGQQHALLMAGNMEIHRQNERQNRNRIAHVSELDSGVWGTGRAMNSNLSPAGWSNLDVRSSEWAAGLDVAFGEQVRAGIMGLDGRSDSTINAQLGNAETDYRGVGLYVGADKEETRMFRPLDIYIVIVDTSRCYCIVTTPHDTAERVVSWNPVRYTLLHE